jgi:hypothetical protein
MGACVLLFIGFSLIAAMFFVERLVRPDERLLIKHSRGLDAGNLLAQLREAELADLRFKDRIVFQIGNVAFLQINIALLASSLAVLAMLIPANVFAPTAEPAPTQVATPTPLPTTAPT